MENYDRAKIMNMKREALGYTRRELCERCNGMSEKTLARLEKGETVRRKSIEELLEFYRQKSHTIYPVMDLERPQVAREQNEVLGLMFHGNYREAKRRQRYVQGYVREENGNGVNYSEVIGKEIECYMGGEGTCKKESIPYFEEQIAKMMPEGADLEKWAFNKKELCIYLAYFNALTQEGRYGEIIPILEKLLVNLERGYQDMETFSNLYGCFTNKLMGALRKEKQYEEMFNIAEKGLKVCGMVGDISNTYAIQSELLCYFEENAFFHNVKIREQCFETVEEMYFLSKVLGDTAYSKYFENYLDKMQQCEKSS